MRKDIDVKHELNTFVNLVSKINNKSDFYFAQVSLLSKYEQLLLNQNETKIIYKSLFISIFQFLFLKHKATNLRSDSNTLYVWPFQFLHCDFLSTIIPELKKNNISHQVLVLRQNLVPYLAEKGISSLLVNFIKSPRNVKSIYIEFFSIIKYLILIIFSSKYLYKKSLISLLIYINQPIMAKAASEDIMAENLNQYHLVGYDLSAMGLPIVNLAKKYNLTSGRIQNGAPNYLLSGYSKVDELFVWDTISRDAYLNNGFKGKTIITGNILLQDTIAKGFDDSWVKELPLKKHYSYKIFVALSGPGHNTTKLGHFETLKQLNAIVAQLPDFAFYIKLHPKDNKAYYQQIAKHSHIYFTDELKSKPDALHILSKSDMLITGASSVALDAIQLGIPVVSIDPLQELNHFDFLNNRNLFKANTTQNILEVKLKLLDMINKSCTPYSKNTKSGVEIIAKQITSNIQN